MAEGGPRGLRRHSGPDAAQTPARSPLEEPNACSAARSDAPSRSRPPCAATDPHPRRLARDLDTIDVRVGHITGGVTELPVAC
ncbi:hypothetical protein TOK_0996 [Pseudonocardia sp. N23]|nr:hypothetical protein TOK_0996 [Pseudonocardia sp. N23]